MSLQAIFTEGVNKIDVPGLYQWDLGRTLKITLESLPTSFQVHFSHKRLTVAYVVEATATDGYSEVTVPNILLQQSTDVTAWIYLSEPGKGKTIKEITLPIIARAKPSDYAPTPDEILNYSSVIEKAKSYANAAAISEANAKASEESAKESRQAAEDAETRVKSIVAGNEAHTIYESDRKFSTAIVGKMSGKSVIAKDSSENPFVGMKMFGKTTQFTTTGAQLLDVSRFKPINSSLVKVSISEDSNEISIESLGDNGTVILYAYYELAGLVDGETYTIGAEYISNNCLVNMDVRLEDGTRENVVNINKPFVYKTEKQYTLKLYLSQLNETVSKGTIKKYRNITLSKGSEALPWEPYTGGVPSPSVDYPQELECLGEWGNLLENTAISQTINGVTFTVNEDKSVTVNGTATDLVYFDINTTFDSTKMAGAIFNGFPPNYKGSTSNLIIRVSSKDSRISLQEILGNNSKILDNGKDLMFAMRINGGYTVNNLTVYPMITYADANITEYHPYTGQKEICVDVLGKNLLKNIVYYENTTVDYAPIIRGDLCNIKKGDTYTVSADITALQDTKAYWNFSNEIFDYGFFTVQKGTFRYSYTAVAKEDCSNLQFIVLTKRATGDSVAIIASNCKLELGEVATEYEPYASQSLITPVSDGLKGIPLGTTIPDAIANSPVHMSGVWWDEDEGQYYISDTIDYESGKYVQRVFEHEFTGSETFNMFASGQDVLPIFYPKYIPVRYSSAMSNVFKIAYSYQELMSIENCVGCVQDGIVIHLEGIKGYNNETHPTAHDFITDVKSRLKEFSDAGKPLRVLYILATPIETDIPESEIVAYKALHSNYPTTTIFNDCDAMMEVGYNADTKLYIDNKFAELAALLV